MRKQKLQNQLQSAYGEVPDVEYFDEDMKGIRMFYDYQREHAPQNFYVDETTWRDLSMDDVFKRMNGAQTSSGEQYLYYMLRTPQQDQASYDNRRDLITLVESDASLRLQLQMILARIGKRRAANTQEAFSPSRKGSWQGIATPVLLLCTLACLVGLFFSTQFLLPLVFFFFVNGAFHTYMMHFIERDMATMNYTVSLVAASRKMHKINHPTLDAILRPAFEAGQRARSIVRQGGLTITSVGDLLMIFNALFLIDLLVYERLKRRLYKYHDDVLIIHEAVGLVDAAIAIASYRRSVSGYAIPEIEFAQDAKPSLAIDGMAHPLIEQSVPNDLSATGPLLVTGSNASGKSTFLKGVALSAIMAQSVCTVVCARYAATSFRIYSSMAIADNVLAGDSYFIAEIKSIKRIADAATRGERILCVIDEVLRGTNTVERIAASSELLRALSVENVLCIAATHDGELNGLLPDYRQVHFSERIEDGEISFDYLLKDGPATTRNAIKLLELLGFDETIVEGANTRAQHYLTTGSWDA